MWCRRPFLFCVIERREIFSSAAVHASLPPRYPQSIPTLVMFSSHLPCSAMDLEVEGATWICGKQFFESKEYSMGSVALFGLFVNRIYLYKLCPSFVSIQPKYLSLVNLTEQWMIDPAKSLNPNREERFPSQEFRWIFGRGCRQFTISAVVWIRPLIDFVNLIPGWERTERGDPGRKDWRREEEEASVGYVERSFCPKRL